MLGIGTLWGITIPLSKIAVSTGYQPFGLIFWQVAISVLVLGAVLLWRGWRPKISRELLFYFSVIAISGTILPNGTSYWAQQHLPAGVMSISIATVPMFTLIIALVLRLEQFSLVRLTGILVAFVAMVLIAAPESSLPDSSKAIFILVALVFLGRFITKELDAFVEVFAAGTSFFLPNGDPFLFSEINLDF